MANNRASIIIESKAAVAPGFRQVRQEFDLLKSAGKQVNNVFTGIGQGIGQRFAGAAFDAIRGVTDLFTQAIPKALAYAKSIDDITDSTGASAKEASILAGTLQILGVPSESLATTFRTLSSEVVTNEKKFKALGIEIRDANGNVLNTVQILDNARRSLSTMEDGAAKTALAVDLFGRSALGLIDYLNLSDEAAASAALELEKMGLVLTDETVRAAEDADRSFNLLGMTVSGLQIELANQLLPTIINVVNAIRNWVMENREGLMNALSSVMGALAGFISGILGATNAMSGFINSLRGAGNAVNTSKAGIAAQIAELQKQRAAYMSSGSAARTGAGGTSAATAAINKQVEALRKQKQALQDVVRAQAEAARAAYSNLLAGLASEERAYELQQQRGQLADDLRAAEQESADARIKFQTELNALREERDFAMAAEADADEQFKIATEYALKEQRLLEQQADEATRLDKAIADARKRISDFELEVKRQAALDEKRARIEAAQETSAEIQKLASADYNFKANIAKLSEMANVLRSQREIALAQGDSLTVQLIDMQLSQIREAIAAQQEAREIARHQRRLDREKARASAAQSSSNAVVAALDAEIKKLEEQLKTYDDLNKKGIEPTTVGNNTFQKSMEKWKQIATDVKNAFKVIGDVFNALKFLYDITIGPIIDGIQLLIDITRTAINLIKELSGAKVAASAPPLYGTPPTPPKGPYPPAPPAPPKKTPTPPPANPFPGFGTIGGRAYGGPVNAGEAFLVGEKGPEMFLPHSAGMIVQGANAGGISINLSAGAFLGSSQDAREFARRIAGALEDEMSRRRRVQPGLPNARRMAV